VVSARSRALSKPRTGLCYRARNTLTPEYSTRVVAKELLSPSEIRDEKTSDLTRRGKSKGIARVVLRWFCSLDAVTPTQPHSQPDQAPSETLATKFTFHSPHLFHLHPVFPSAPPPIVLPYYPVTPSEFKSAFTPCLFGLCLASRVLVLVLYWYRESCWHSNGSCATPGCPAWPNKMPGGREIDEWHNLRIASTGVVRNLGL